MIHGDLSDNGSSCHRVLFGCMWQSIWHWVQTQRTVFPEGLQKAWRPRDWASFMEKEEPISSQLAEAISNLELNRNQLSLTEKKNLANYLVLSRGKNKNLEATSWSSCLMEDPMEVISPQISWFKGLISCLLIFIHVMLKLQSACWNTQRLPHSYSLGA